MFNALPIALGLGLDGVLEKDFVGLLTNCPFAASLGRPFVDAPIKEAVSRAAA